MRKKINRSVLDKYREIYEAGLLIIDDVARLSRIGINVTGKYIIASKWNVPLAKHNRSKIKKQILCDKINQYKEAFEQGKITIVTIMKSLKCSFNTMCECMEKNKWDRKVNKYNLTKIAEKRKKIKSMVSSFKIGEIFYTSEGLPLIFKGIKNGKPSVKHTLYTKHTYTNQEIKDIENEYKESQM